MGWGIQREIRDLLKEILCEVKEIKHILEPRLTRIRIAFEGESSMPTPGPLKLTSVGQTGTAVIVGFDQFGNPWTGAIPTPTFSGDNAAVATVDPTSGLVTAVANGTENLTGSLTTAEGTPLSDTEQVIVDIPPPPTPILSKIQVQFE